MRMVWETKFTGSCSVTLTLTLTLDVYNMGPRGYTCKFSPRHANNTNNIEDAQG